MTTDKHAARARTNSSHLRHQCSWLYARCRILPVIQIHAEGDHRSLGKELSTFRTAATLGRPGTLRWTRRRKDFAVILGIREYHIKDEFYLDNFFFKTANCAWGVVGSSSKSDAGISSPNFHSGSVRKIVVVGL